MMSILREYFNPRNLVINLILLAAYIIAGKFGLSLAEINPQASAFWPPTGIAIAAFILFGEKVFPAIYIGAFVVNFTTAGSVPTSLAIAFGNTLEGLVAASFITKYANGKDAFIKIADILKFTLFAALLGPVISATVGTATLYFAGSVAFENITEVWRTWVLGDAAGALTVAPIILIWAKGFGPHAVSIRKVVESIISFWILALFGWLIFSGVFPFTYFCIPILIWIVFRFGNKGGSIAIVILSVIALYNTLILQGPFIQPALMLNDSLLQFQVFMATISITTFIFAALFFRERQAQRSLTSQELRFKALIEKSSDGIVLLNIVGTIIYAGPSTEKVFGYKPEEVVGRNAFDFLHPDDRVRVLKILVDLVKKPGETVETEYRVIKKNKQICWVESIGTNLLLDSNVSAVVVNLRDVSEQKFAEYSLREEKAEDEAILASIGDGIIATDRDGRVTLVNPAFEQILGFGRNQIMGKMTNDFLEIEDDSGKPIPATSRLLAKALKLRQKVAATHYLVRSDKTKFPASVVATPIFFEGQIVGAIEVIHDITKEKEVDRAKSEFISTASHQLKTPLGTEKWYLESLIGSDYFKDLPQQDQEYVRQVYESNQRLSSLVRDLLDIAKIEQGKTIDKPEIINITELVIEIIKQIQAEADRKNIDIRFENNKEVLIKIDKKRFTAVIENILSNAVKYSNDNGRVVLKLNEKDGNIIIDVIDNGIGIETSDQEKIFAKFYRGLNANSKNTSGSGLGLYLVKSYVDYWKGKVWFESEVGRGTSFHVQIPITS